MGEVTIIKSKAWDSSRDMEHGTAVEMGTILAISLSLGHLLSDQATLRRRRSSISKVDRCKTDLRQHGSTMLSDLPRVGPVRQLEVLVSRASSSALQTYNSIASQLSRGRVIETESFLNPQTLLRLYPGTTHLDLSAKLHRPIETSRLPTESLLHGRRHLIATDQDTAQGRALSRREVILDSSHLLISTRCRSMRIMRGMLKCTMIKVMLQRNKTSRMFPGIFPLQGLVLLDKAAAPLPTSVVFSHLQYATNIPLPTFKNEATRCKMVLRTTVCKIKPELGPLRAFKPIYHSVKDVLRLLSMHHLNMQKPSRP